MTETPVAILWHDAHKILNGNVPDLLTAVGTLADVSLQVATTLHGFPHPMALHIFLIGEGNNVADKLQSSHNFPVNQDIKLD